ncbi:MAG: ABC transporter substrate-binding protein [Clostridia bacterium]
MKKCLSMALVVLLLFTGCGANSVTTPAVQQATEIMLTDLDGNQVTLKNQPVRVVSLSPTNTEIMFAIGAEAQLVGVTSYCDYPAAAKDIAKIGDFEGANLELITAAKPDLVLAGSYMQEDIITALADLGIPVLSTEATSMNQIFSSIRLVGKATGNDAGAEKVVAEMEKNLASIAEKVAGKTAKSVFYCVWQDPLTTAGKNTFIDEAITLAGGKNVVTLDGWTEYSKEQLLTDEPDLLISAKFSSDAGETLASVKNNEIFKNLACVKNDKVYLMKDDNLISRGGPRIVLAIEEIRQALEK